MSSSETLNSIDKPAQKEQATHSSKRKYEHIWKLLFLAVTIVASILLRKIYIFQTHPYFENVRQGNIFELLLYGLPFAAVFLVVDWLIHYFMDDLCMKYYITQKKYLEPESRKKRCYTLVKWLYSISFYCVTSIWAYKILIGTSFMPTWLGGHGSPYNMGKYAPGIPEATDAMKAFYIVQFGKHFGRFFGHVFIRPEGNFFEYALHHGLSIFLIVFSYLTNLWHIGIFVLFVHDYSDFSLQICRAYRDYRYNKKWILRIFDLQTAIVWTGGRIFAFIGVCIIPSIYILVTEIHTLPQIVQQVLTIPYYFMSFMMICLQILNLYWTYYIFESIVSVSISSKMAKHTYD